MFEDPQVNELGWTHLTLSHAVQKHIIDTKWKPVLWTTDTFNFVIDMTGNDKTLCTEWLLQTVDAIHSALVQRGVHKIQMNIITDKQDSKEKAILEGYEDAVFVTKPKSTAEYVKHLVTAADIVFCTKLDSDGCHIAALAGTRAGFVVRGEEEGFNYCPGAGMCTLVTGKNPVPEEDLAFVHGIAERWNMGKYTKCL